MTCPACARRHDPERLCSRMRDALWTIVKAKPAIPKAQRWARSALGLDDR